MVNPPLVFLCCCASLILFFFLFGATKHDNVGSTFSQRRMQEEEVAEEEDSTRITHLGSRSVWTSDGRYLTIARPSQATQPGDLLLLFLSRTDDYLPWQLEGWKKGPACWKTSDRQNECHGRNDCTRWDGDYCLAFGRPYLDGMDLATAVYYRTIDDNENEPWQYTFRLRCWMSTNCKPAWAILTGLRGADQDDPIGDSATRSMDKLDGSGFPSVRAGSPGDKLLLSMAFDDGLLTGVRTSTFRPPIGTNRLGYVIGEDEAGFLFGQDLDAWGATGTKTTRGPGVRFKAKDAMISLIVKKKQNWL